MSKEMTEEEKFEDEVGQLAYNVYTKAADELWESMPKAPWDNDARAWKKWGGHGAWYEDRLEEDRDGAPHNHDAAWRCTRAHGEVHKIVCHRR